MRRLLIIIIMAFAFVSCGRNEKIVGKWMITNNDLNVAEAFEADGTYLWAAQADIKGNTFIGGAIKGHWDSEGDDIIKVYQDSVMYFGAVVENPNKGEPAIYKITMLTDDRMIYDYDGKVRHLVRFE